MKLAHSRVHFARRSLVLLSIATALAGLTPARAETPGAVTGRWRLANTPMPVSGLPVIDVSGKDGRFAVIEVMPDGTCGALYTFVEAHTPQESKLGFTGYAPDANGKTRRVYLSMNKGRLALLVEADHSPWARAIPMMSRHYDRSGPAKCEAPVS